jgi:single-stranded DNA-specific DHH superfamily exonuclease
MTVRRFDVCNGDADGLCAAVQWRLHEPAPAALLTGLKREIALVGQVQAQAGDEINVFDLSMRPNRDALQRLLGAGVRVRYFDHHMVEDMPVHPLLESHVDTASDACTSLLVDRRLGGAFRPWALVGIYGDNLAEVADRLALESNVDAGDCALLRRLGEAINYNAYGDHEGDVHIAPRALHAIMLRYRDPRDMLAHEPVVDEIDAQRRSDLQQALAVAPLWQDEGASVRVLPDAPWSRRVLGCIANELANAEPQRAHAVLKRQGRGYSVSVRAPLVSPAGAHALCSRFGGGGRARAAGIDGLAHEELERFVCAFARARWGERPDA